MLGQFPGKFFVVENPRNVQDRRTKSKQTQETILIYRTKGQESKNKKMGKASKPRWVLG